MGQEDEMVTPTEHVNRLREIACITLDNAAREIRHAADTIEQLQDTCQDLRRKNDRLRELAGAVREFVGDVNCDACYLRSHCDDNNRVGCGVELSYHAFEAMRDLGIEVDE